MFIYTKNYKILFNYSEIRLYSLRRVLHHRAEFYGDRRRSYRCTDIAVFHVFPVKCRNSLDDSRFNIFLSVREHGRQSTINIR